MNGIKFKRIKTAYTSQDCWECGGRGSREGRSITCTNIKHHASEMAIHTHSDLNTARVIALS
ncbi:MAG: transposase [Candidatus Lokiarchaeota archaeon]|nr:transposase [Candidatus Lokiarchaeota archaeon]